MNGILLVDKPAGWTSHDVVAKLRGVLGERRMGHSGTLDPMATGLLVVFAGRATRAVSFSENHTKCYEAHLRLGLTTDTQDTTGTVLSRCDRRVTRAELEAALNMEDTVESRAEKGEAERPSVLADLKSKSEDIPPAKRSEGYEEVL